MKIVAAETWRAANPTGGAPRIAAELPAYVAEFTAALEMDNHAVREAGAHVLREVPPSAIHT